MRTGAAISVTAHLAALAACLVLASVHPFEPTTAEAITVDIITPDQAPPLPKEPEPELPTISDKDSSQTSEPQQKPAENTPQEAAPPPDQKTQQAALSQKPSEPPKPAEPPKAAEPAKPAEQPKPAGQQQTQSPQPSQEQQQAVPTAAPDITSRYGMMFTLPDAGAAGDFDAKAAAKANLKAEDIAALRARLKDCAILPKSVAPSDNVRIVLRIALTPNGRLAQEPLLIEASASAKGPVLMRSAMDALEKCQPYTMLPADRYNEWRMLDLSFTPKDFKS